MPRPPPPVARQAAPADRPCRVRPGLLTCGMTRLVLQVHFDRENRIGPGKIELLERIAETGSISAAGRAMDMSYRRAWLLVAAMNRTFNAPVVATRLGGASMGRAVLTPLGREVVQLYREIGESALGAAKSKNRASGASDRSGRPTCAGPVGPGRCRGHGARRRRRTAAASPARRVRPPDPGSAMIRVVHLIRCSAGVASGDPSPR